MKVTGAFICFAASVSAFSLPPSSLTEVACSRSSALNANPFGTVKPFDADGVYVGVKEWELLTTKWGSEDTGKYMRASELKHGRSAMIAIVGFALQKFGVSFASISPHEYLSVTQGVKFSDLLALGPVEAIKATPPEGLAQIFCAIAAIEIYELTHAGGEIKYGERVAPGLQSGGLTGDLGWNPMRVTVTDDLRLKEIQNGRAAMVAISGWVANEVIPGSFPIPLPWS